MHLSNTILPKLVLLYGFSLLFSYGWITCLKKFKRYQPIYSLSPVSHQKKSKTPSFGGVVLSSTVTLGCLIFSLFSPKILWVMGLFLSFSVLGFLDDFIATIGGQNKGFSATQKLALQCVLATAFILGYHLWIMPLHLGVALFYIFLIVGTSNATNLTDGLDGLLGGLALITMTGFLYLFQCNPEFFAFCSLFFPALLGFLWFNKHPAKLFMGDTGSLALGACFSGLAIVANKPLSLLCLGSVYVIETLSVMIQVLSFKLRKKRVFLMTPLHHHFELLGLPEKQVVRLFWIMGLLFLIWFRVSL